MRAWRSLTAAMWKAMLADRSALFFYFLFPLMFLVLFGLLFGGSDVGRVTIGVTGDGPLVEALPDEVIEVEHYDDFDEAVEAVVDGDLPAALRVDGTEVELRYSATEQVAAGTVHSVVQSVVGQANLAASETPPTYTLEASQVEDESFEPIQFLTGGLLSWAVAMSASFGAALNLVVWRKNHVLRRLRLAPIHARSIVGARIGVSLIIAMLQGAVFVLLALTPPFGLQLPSTWYLMIPLLAAGTLAFLSIGLLVGSLTRTEEAASGAVNLIILPMAFLSGTFFPTDDLPAWLQTVSRAFPMRHLTEGLLDVIVRDRGIAAVLAPMAILCGFAAVITAIASRFFSWED